MPEKITWGRTCMFMHVISTQRDTWMHAPFTAILIIIEGCETVFNGFRYHFTTGKPLKNLKLTLTYYENGSRKTSVFFLVSGFSKIVNWISPLSEVLRGSIVQCMCVCVCVCVCVCRCHFRDHKNSLHVFKLCLRKQL